MQMRTVIAIGLYLFSTVMLAARERYLHFMGLFDALVRARDTPVCFVSYRSRRRSPAASRTPRSICYQLSDTAGHNITTTTTITNTRCARRWKADLELPLRNRNDTTTMPISSTVAILAVFVGRLVDLTVCNACNWVVLRLMQTLGAVCDTRGGHSGHSAAKHLPFVPEGPGG